MVVAGAVISTGTNQSCGAVNILATLEDAFGNPSANMHIAHIIVDIINGKQDAYIKRYLGGIFQGEDGPSGMRLSVYCADQAACNNAEVIHQIDNVYP